MRGVGRDTRETGGTERGDGEAREGQRPQPNHRCMGVVAAQLPRPPRILFVFTSSEARQAIYRNAYRLTNWRRGVEKPLVELNYACREKVGAHPDCFRNED